jgi:hypothetical protein
LQPVELLLLCLVLGDGHAAALPTGRLRAVGPKGAGAADLRIEVNGLAELERLHLACGARDSIRAEVDAEVGL